MRCSICRDSTLGGCHEDPANPSRRLSLQRRQADGGFLQAGSEHGPAGRHCRGPGALDQGARSLHAYLSRRGRRQYSRLLRASQLTPNGERPQYARLDPAYCAAGQGHGRASGSQKVRRGGWSRCHRADRSHDLSIDLFLGSERPPPRGRDVDGNTGATGTWSRNGPEPRALPGTRRGSTRRRLQRRNRRPATSSLPAVFCISRRRASPTAQALRARVRSRRARQWRGRESAFSPPRFRRRSWPQHSVSR